MQYSKVVAAPHVRFVQRLAFHIVQDRVVDHIKACILLVRVGHVRERVTFVVVVVALIIKDGEIGV